MEIGYVLEYLRSTRRISTDASDSLSVEGNVIVYRGGDLTRVFIVEFLAGSKTEGATNLAAKYADGGKNEVYLVYVKDYGEIFTYKAETSTLD